MNEKYLAEVSAKKNLLLKCAEPPPPLNKMVVDNITTTATRHCLNDIWIHRSQNISKSVQSFCTEIVLKSPPPPFSLSQVDCIDPTLTIYRFFFSSQSLSISVQEWQNIKWGMFYVNKKERERSTMYDFWHAVSYILFKIILFINLISNIYLIELISLFEYFLKICATIWQNIFF